MRSTLSKLVLTRMAIALGCMQLLTASAFAQCQRGSQNSGNTSSLANTGYSQLPLTNSSGYTQNSLNPFGYNQQFLAQVAANDQMNRYARDYAAMQVRAQSQMVQNQIAQTKAMRKELDKLSAEKRKAALQEREEALAMRAEREAARRGKSLDSAERSPIRLASTGQ